MRTKLKRAISIVLTVVMIFGVFTIAPFSVNAATITLHAWISDSIMGEEAKSYYVRNMYYLCYELIDQNGNRLDSIGNWSYTVTETMYEVDGSVAHTYSYNNDNNYIGIRRNQAGTYKGNVTVTGDINISVGVSYTLSYNAGLSSSSSNVSLNLNGTNSATLRITPTGAYPGSFSLSRSYDDDIVNVTFNKWDGDTAVYNVNGLKVGSTNLVFKLKENYTGSKTVVASVSIPISVTANIYTISYHPNGGTGAPSSQSAYYGNSLTVSSTIPTRSGYEFVGWGLNSSSKSPFCEPGDTISLGSNMTVYAIWSKKQTSISDCTINLGTTSYTYDGTAKEPSITVKDGSTTLTNGTDYVVYYSDNINVGAATVTIAGRGNYSGAALRTFIINAKSISSATVTLGTTSYTYDGAAKEPSVTVKDGATTLTNGTDYTVVYSDNTNAGTATVTITGKGNYTGTVSKTFTIKAKSISRATVTLGTTSYTYDGTAKKPSVTVKDGTTTLTNGTDYTVTYSDNVEVGTATVLITGKGNYSGSLTEYFTIKPDGTPSIVVSSATAKAGDTVDVTITMSNNPGFVSANLYVNYDTDVLTLKKVKDGGLLTGVMHSDNYVTSPYGLCWVNDTALKNFTVNGVLATLTFEVSPEAAAGTSTISLEQDILNFNMDNVVFDLVSGDIQIENKQNKNIPDCKISLAATSYTYDGTAKKPSVTVKDGSTTLTNGTDYTVSYSNNTNAGTATVTITGKGNYSGTVSKTFTINTKSISSATVTLGTTSYTYDGTAKKPSVTVKDGSTTLTNGTDYTVSYSNNTNAGTATVTITGKGNYSGAVSKTFTINTKSISSATVTLGTTSYTYDGTAKKPSVTVKDGATTLTNGTDYTVSYSNNTNVGTATVTITGKGNYTGTVSKTFTINTKSISSATVTLGTTSYTYDGTARKPSVTVKDGSTTLTNGTDYTVSYSNNTNVGTATVTITGKGNYTGIASKTFTINAKSISSTSVTLGTTSYTYDGTAKKPSVTVKDGSKTLTSGTDYTVSYSNNTNAGTATVTVTGKGNYTGTVSKNFTITNSKQEFTWGQDNWNFNNTSYYFTNYNVNSTVMNLMKEDFNLSDSDIYELQNKISWDNFIGFKGSCFGMTISEILAKQGDLKLSRYGLNDVVYKNSNTSNATSVINFIQELQSNSNFCQSIRQAPFLSGDHTQYDFIDKIESVLENEDNLVKISYGIKLLNRNTGEYFSNGYHAVLGYGIEDCEYYSSVTGKTYDKRVLIADPNYSSGTSLCNEACIYYRSSDHSWIVPYWYQKNSSYTQLCYWNSGSSASTNTGNIRNIMKYNSLTETVDLMADYQVSHYVAGLEIDNFSDNETYVEQISNSGNPNLDYAGGSEPGIARYDIEMDDSYNVYENNEFYALWNPTANYEMSYSKPSDYNLKMDYDNVTYYAELTNSFYTLFKPSGAISVKGSNSEYDITMVTDDADCVTDWYAVGVSGNYMDDLVFTKVKGGYTLESSNLNNVTINAKNNNADVSRTFSTQYNSVFIYEIDENTIGLKVDTDNNGTYETELNTKLIGDVNGDDSVTVQDATVLQKYLAGLVTLSDEQLAVADTNGDGSVTVADATVIQKYLAGLVTVLG